ncbi:MAG: beta-propeller domain-containing protein [Myxococcales bacterium]|nr:beta-propeller domain-containing protein [Myxococcales bacterium]
MFFRKNGSAKEHWFAGRPWLFMGVQMVLLLFFYQCSMGSVPTGPNLGAGSATPAAQITAPQTTPSTTVQEADIYRVVGEHMFALHRGKGLIILKLKDGEKPHKVSFLPLQGIPVEMFVQKETAYILMQASVITQMSSLQPSEKVVQSMLVAVDIRDVRAPKLLQRASLPGRVIAGSSRLLEDRLYVVTHDPSVVTSSWSGSPKADTPAAMLVVSVDVRDPQRFRMMQNFALRTNFPAPLLLDDGSAFTDLDSGSVNGSADFSQISDALVAKSYAITDVRPTRFLQFVVTGTKKRLLVTETWLADVRVWTYQTEMIQGVSRSSGCFGVGAATETRVEKRLVAFPAQLNFTVVNVLDISDTAGKISLHSRFRLHGLLPDQTKQNVLEMADGTLAYIGITMRNQLHLDQRIVKARLANVATSVSLDGPRGLRVMSGLFFGKEKEAVRATLFDEKRQVLFAITSSADPELLQGSNLNFEAIRERRERLLFCDPLYTIDLKDPAKLSILGALDDLNGDMNFFRPIQGGDFLLAVGRDTSATCTGFEPASGRFSRTSVSLVDVRDLTKPKLVQRRCVGVNVKADIVSSEVNWDLDQAHKQIGFYSEGNTHLISVPVEFSYREEGVLKDYTAVGLMRWDLGRYDENKGPAEQDVLQELGTFLHPRGRVERTFFEVLQYNQEPRLSLINFSQDALSITDLEYLEKPRLASTLELSPQISHVFWLKEKTRILMRKVIPATSGPSTYLWQLRQVAEGVALEDGALLGEWPGQAEDIPMMWGEQLLLQKGNSLMIYSFAEDKIKSSVVVYPKGAEALVAEDLFVRSAKQRRVLLTKHALLTVGRYSYHIGGEDYTVDRVFALDAGKEDSQFKELRIEETRNTSLYLMASGDEVIVLQERAGKFAPQYYTATLRMSAQGTWDITPFGKEQPGRILHRFEDGRVLVSLGSSPNDLGQLSLGLMQDNGFVLEQSLPSTQGMSYKDVTVRGDDVLLMTSANHLLRYKKVDGFLQFVRQWTMALSEDWVFGPWDKETFVLLRRVAVWFDALIVLDLEKEADASEHLYYAGFSLKPSMDGATLSQWTKLPFSTLSLGADRIVMAHDVQGIVFLPRVGK